MLSWVDADESRDSGPGETVTREPASAAETFRPGGTQRGEIFGSLNLLAVAVASAPARLERPAIATPAPARSTAVATASASLVRALRSLTP
jgi:hypothetical protein